MTTTAAQQPRSKAIAPAHPAKWPGFVVTTVALASFGPYMVGSIRTEQAVVYGLMLLSFPLILTRFNPNGGLRFLIPWSAYVVISTLGVLLPSAGAPYESGNLLGGLDNLLAPLAVMLLIWSVVPQHDAERLLLRFCKVVAVAMAANGALAIASTFVDLTAALRPFWATGDELSTTADLAAQMGRYSGIFNQPAEAGALYGLGGIAAIYAWQKRPLFVALLLALMTVGGLVSVSKIFIFGGLPVMIVYWFWSQRGGKKVAALFGVGLIALGVVQSGLLAEWTGLRYLGRLFVTGDQDYVNLYGAGRFEEESTFLRVSQSALDFNPITGVGAAGWKIPYDGAIAEFLVIGGVIGLLMFGIVLVGMFFLQRELKGSGALRGFAFFLLVLTAGASLGFSPLTANRVTTVTWVMVALLVLVARDRKARAAAESDRVAVDAPALHPAPPSETVFATRRAQRIQGGWIPNGARAPRF